MALTFWEERKLGTDWVKQELSYTVTGAAVILQYEYQRSSVKLSSLNQWGRVPSIPEIQKLSLHREMAEDSLHWHPNSAEPTQVGEQGPAHTRVCMLGWAGSALAPAGRGLQGRPHTRGLLDVYNVELRATLPAPQEQGYDTSQSQPRRTPSSRDSGKRTGHRPASPRLQDEDGCSRSPLPYHHQL